MTAGVRRFPNGKNAKFRHLFRRQHEHVPRNGIIVMLRQVCPHYRWGNHLALDPATPQFMIQCQAEANHERLRGTVGRHVRNGSVARAGSDIDYDAPAATLHGR